MTRDEKTKLIHDNASDQLNPHQLAKLIGLSYDQVRYVVLRDNLPHRKFNPKTDRIPKKYTVKITNEMRLQIIEYYRNNLSMQEITEKYEQKKISVYQVKKILIAAGIEVRKRQPSKVKKKIYDKVKKRYTNNYWFNEQEKAVIDYVQEKDITKKNLIFAKYLYEPLIMMAGIILKKYFSGNITTEDNVYDAVTHVAINLYKFDFNKIKSKTGAYSYCSTIVKYFYLDQFVATKNLRNKKKRQHNTYSIDNQIVKNEELDLEIFQNYNDDNYLYNYLDIDVVRQVVVSKLQKEKSLITNEIRRQIYDFMIELFEKRIQYNKFFMTYILKTQYGLDTHNKIKHCFLCIPLLSKMCAHSGLFFRDCEQILEKFTDVPVGIRTMDDIIEAFYKYEDYLILKKLQKKDDYKERQKEINKKSIAKRKAKH